MVRDSDPAVPGEAARIERAYRLLFDRAPTAAECTEGVDYLHKAHRDGKAWERFVRTLIALALVAGCETAIGKTEGEQWTWLLVRARLVGSRQEDDRVLGRVAFAQLVERCQLCVFQRAFRILNHKDDAQEIVQETMLRVWKKLGVYRAPSEGGESGSARASAKTWIKTIAERLAIDRKRKKREKTTGLPPEDDQDRPAGPPSPPSAGPLNGVMTQEVRDQVRAALAKLGQKKDRIALEMFHLDDADYQAIAARLQISVAAVGPLLTRAREKLRGLLPPGLVLDWGWQLSQALDKLTENYRQALVMCHQQGADCRTIADRLALAEPEVGPLLARARQALRDLLPPVVADELDWFD
jgi:RNA polymerase sigma-70 factor (ECF subfamily)